MCVCAFDFFFFYFNKEKFLRRSQSVKIGPFALMIPLFGST